MSLTKRQLHFRQWLDLVRGNNPPSIPPEILEEVTDVIYAKNQRVEDIKPAQVRDALKKLRRNRYYRDAVQITAMISGKPVPVSIMTAAQEEKVLDMFDAIERKQKALDMSDTIEHQKHFFGFSTLSYNYLVHKILEVLGENDLAERFPFLRCKDKLRAQDRMWARLCEQCGWDFSPSLCE